MSYRRSLLTRWSRRDLLAILIIALGVAFLTGSVVLVTGIGAESTAIAAEYGTHSSIQFHDSLTAAQAASGPNATVFPIAAVTSSDGSQTVVIGRPDESPAGLTEPIVDASPGVTLGTISQGVNRTLTGDEGTVHVPIHPRTSDTAIPSRWYVANASIVSTLGPTGALVVDPAAGPGTSIHGVPLQSVLLFFVLGTQELVGTLGVVAAGSGILVGVVVWSVTRMSIRDRLRTIRIIRSTGGSPWTIRGIFTARSTLLTLVGVLLGYAIGIISVNAAANLAVFLGLPISIDVSLSRHTAWLILGLAGAIACVGPIAGLLATRPAVKRDPADLTEVVAVQSPRPEGFTVLGSLFERFRRFLEPNLLPWRALIPTTATLAAFVTFAVLIAAMAGVVTPLTSPNGVSITEPGATHPIASTLSETHVQTLADRGIDASGEILLFEVLDGQPYLARGVNYSHFEAVTDTTLVRGRQPQAVDEAVIGADLARTLEVGVGDRILVGGSTQPGFDRLTIVGLFEAPGHYDDELLVSLTVARHLEDDPQNTVQFIRADRLPKGDLGEASGLYVGSVRAPETVPRGESFTVTVTVHNVAPSQASQRVAISFDGREEGHLIRLGPNQQGTVQSRFTANDTGRHTIRVENTTRRITVVGRTDLRLPLLPERAPVGSDPLLVVRTPFGEAVPNATVTIENNTLQTDERGMVRVSLDTVGTHRITVSKGDRSLTRTIEVREGDIRRPVVDVTVTPNPSDILTVPRVSVTVFNPWNVTITHDVHLVGPGLERTQTLSIEPGDSQRLTSELARRPPGSYGVQVSFDGRPMAEVTYRVTGDDRIVAAMASGSRRGKSGIGRAAETAFGNLRFMLAVLLLLAAAMSIGGTTAAFAQAVHSRRRTIGVFRATGDTPWSILLMVVQDSLRIGLVSSLLASLLAALALHLVGILGYLTVFGVTLRPSFEPLILLGIFTGALVVTAVSAGFATLAHIQVEPWMLLGADTGGPVLGKTWSGEEDER